MAEASPKALVSNFGPLPAAHLAEWRGTVGCPGQVWVEDDGLGLWLVRVLRSPVWGAGEAKGELVRAADAADRERFAARQAEVAALQRTAQKEAKGLLPAMKFVAGEVDLERRHVRLFFTAPARVDFRELCRRLGRAFGARVELRALGTRDVARVLGEIGPCGRPLCCRAFLQDLRPIPLRLAFDQGLTVSPERITGVCGRLMCCLRYEHEQYVEAMQGLPKVGEEVDVEGRQGKVVGVNAFLGIVSVQWPDGPREELPWRRRGTAH